MSEASVLSIPVDYHGIWHWGWAIGLILCLWFNFRGPGLVALYFIGRAVWTLEAPLLPYGDYTRAFQATAGQAALEMVLLMYTATWVVRHHDARISDWVKGLVVVEIAGIWYQRAGLMGWESFDCGLLALCLPFIRGKWRDVLSIAIFITLFTHHATTAMAMVFIQMVAINWKNIWTAVPVGAAVWYHHHGPWLDGQTRFDQWKMLMSYWIHTNDATFFIGTGPASFMWISILVAKFKAPIFLWMHNDWLQILFEEGVIGLIMVGGLFVWATKKAPSTKIRGALLAAGVFGLTWHPLRFFPSALLIAILFARVLQTQRKDALS